MSKPAVFVEPEGGLSDVDRDFYVMQCELYTTQPFGLQADQEMDIRSVGPWRTNQRPVKNRRR